jgi:type III pantothenate kinase
MLLALDVGNTNTTIGVFTGREILRRWRLTTARGRTVDEVGILIRQLCEWAEITPADIDGVVVGSVVPPLDHTLREAIRTYLKSDPLFIAPGIRSGMPLKVDAPLELGADRLCNAVAAFAEFGGPSVIIDFGTATTWEVVSQKGEFLGGVIAPGLEISAEALFSRAAKLPRIELVAPTRVIGKGTADSMQAGLIYGYVGLTEGVTRRILAELGGGKVIATGGLAKVLAPYTDLFDAVDDDLTLKGLRLLWERNSPQSPGRSSTPRET